MATGPTPYWQRVVALEALCSQTVAGEVRVPAALLKRVATELLTRRHLGAALHSDACALACMLVNVGPPDAGCDGGGHARETYECVGGRCGDCATGGRAHWLEGAAGRADARLSALERLPATLVAHTFAYLDSDCVLRGVYATSRRMRRHVCAPGSVTNLTLRAAELPWVAQIVPHTYWGALRRCSIGAGCGGGGAVVAHLGPKLRALHTEDAADAIRCAPPAIWPALRELSARCRAATSAAWEAVNGRVFEGIAAADSVAVAASFPAPPRSVPEGVAAAADLVDAAAPVPALPALQRLHFESDAPCHQPLYHRVSAFLGAATPGVLRHLSLHIHGWTPGFQAALAAHAPWLEVLRLTLNLHHLRHTIKRVLPPLPRARVVVVRVESWQYPHCHLMLTPEPHPHLVALEASEHLGVDLPPWAWREGCGLSSGGWQAPALRYLSVRGYGEGKRPEGALASPTGAVEVLNVSVDAALLLDDPQVAQTTRILTLEVNAQRSTHLDDALARRVLQWPNLEELRVIGNRREYAGWAHVTPYLCGPKLKKITNFYLKSCPHPPTFPAHIAWTHERPEPSARYAMPGVRLDDSLLSV